MKISIKNLLSAAAIGSIVLFVASACGDKATFDAVTAADGARVKFLHAVQGGTPVVVFANNKKWSARLNSVAYGPDSLVYGDVYPSIDYSVFTAGETTFDIKTTAAAAVVSSKVTLESGKYYTLIATHAAQSENTIDYGRPFDDKKR